jgi:hypothetical protein
MMVQPNFPPVKKRLAVEAGFAGQEILPVILDGFPTDAIAPSCWFSLR